MPGRRCWYTAIVKAGVECPSRSLTTFSGTPTFRSNVAWVGQPPLAVHLAPLDGLGLYPYVQHLTRPSTDQAVYVGDMS